MTLIDELLLQNEELIAKNEELESKNEKLNNIIQKILYEANCALSDMSPTPRDGAILAEVIINQIDDTCAGDC